MKVLAAGLLALYGWASAACTNPIRCLDDRCEPAGGSGGAGASSNGGSGATGATGGTGGTTASECGNGVVEGNEACDRDRFPTGDSCATKVENGQGALLCKADCSLVTSYCNTLCGNGVVDESELCDGLPTQTCDAIYPGATGTLGCNANCMGFDTTLCVLPTDTCSDGEVTEAEQCDTRVTATCTDLVAALRGPLACHGNCTFDTSACTRCGNGALDPGEQCDGESSDIDFNCDLLGYGGGELTCTEACTFDISGCGP